MATLVIKNLSDALHARLREQARRNHRSVTKEVVALIESSVDAAVVAGENRAAANPLDALFAAGDELARRGVDAESWAQHSGEVWR